MQLNVLCILTISANFFCILCYCMTMYFNVFVTSRIDGSAENVVFEQYYEIYTKLNNDNSVTKSWADGSHVADN